MLAPLTDDESPEGEGALAAAGAASKEAKGPANAGVSPNVGVDVSIWNELSPDLEEVGVSEACTSATHIMGCISDIAGVLARFEVVSTGGEGRDFVCLTGPVLWTLDCVVETFSWLLVRRNLDDLGAAVIEESETLSVLRGRRF